MSGPTTFIANIDAHELTVRIIEGFTGQDRPAGMTATQIIDITDDDLAERAHAAGRKALEYFAQCLGDATREQ
jgi:hypothetical protein